MCLYYYTVKERNHDEKSSKKIFRKPNPSSTLLFYTDKCQDIYIYIYIYFKFKNKRFSHIIMAQERAIQDTNKTNMASPINFIFSLSKPINSY